MTGGFVLVVGPSGAGKDTLIERAKSELAGDARFVFPRRLVTRPRSAWEDHEPIDQDAFEHAEAAGRFCLSWRAHGLCYAIGVDAIEATRLGRTAVCNVSRSIIEDARSRLGAVTVIEVTAPVEILARRLAARARKEDGDLQERLLRSRAMDDVQADLTIVNDRTPEEGAAEMISFLQGRAGARQRERAEAGTCP